MGALRWERACVRTLAAGGEPAGWEAGTGVLAVEDRLWMGAGVGGWEEDRPDGCSWDGRVWVASSRGLRALGCGMGVCGTVPEDACPRVTPEHEVSRRHPGRVSHLVACPPLPVSSPWEEGWRHLCHLVKGRTGAREVRGFARECGLTEGPHSSRGPHEGELSLPFRGTGLAQQPLRTVAVTVFCKTPR